MTGLIGWAVVFAGVVVMAFSALAAVLLSAVVDRLHLLAVTNSFGAPLVGLGLVICEGWSAASAMVVVITALVLLTAPVMSAATARLTAQYAGVVDQGSPP